MALLCEISGLFIKKEAKNAQEKFSAANPRFIRMVMRVTEDRVKETISPLGDGNGEALSEGMDIRLKKQYPH